MSEGSGTKVTAEDIDNGESVSRVIKDDYSLVTDGDCFVSSIQIYPKAGTHIITIKNAGGKR